MSPLVSWSAPCLPGFAWPDLTFPCVFVTRSRANSKVPSEASDTEHDGDHNLPPIGGASGSIPGPRVVARAKGGGGAGAGAGTSAHHGFQSRSTYQAQGKHRQKRAAGATGFAGSQAGGATLHSYTSASKARAGVAAAAAATL